MSAPEPSALVRAALPRGFADRDALDIAGADAMMAKIRAVYQLYGFEAVETPFVEFTQALGKFLPDLDRPNEGVFSFQDDDEQWLSLRYDLTAPLARYVAENYEKLPKPYRSYRAGWVFRNEKPGPGRFRQFMQFDADTVGAASPAADAEICMMAADCLEALGVQRGDYVVKVNNRKVLDGVMEAIGLGGAEHAGRRLTCCAPSTSSTGSGRRACARCSAQAARTRAATLPRGRGSTTTAIGRVLAYTAGAGAETTPRRSAALAAAVAGSADWRGGAGGTRRRSPRSPRAAGYGQDRILIDPSVVRGLEYYTGPVFEAELTFEVKDEAGRPVRFGSVGGGGRYDGLVARFRAEPVPATGFSIGVSRLLAALRAIKSPIVAGAPSPVRSSCSCSTATGWPTTSASSPVARGGNRLRALSRRRRPQRPAQIRRQARLALRGHPGLQRARRRRRPAGRDPRPRARRRTRQGEQGPRRLSGNAPARPGDRPGGRTRRPGAGGHRAPGGAPLLKAA